MLATFGIILLTYSISVQLISVFSPIPFLGFAVMLLAFPLALKLSFKELFLVEIVGCVSGVALRFDNFILYYNLVTSGVFATFQYQFTIGFIAGIILGITVFPLFSTFFMKFLARKITPKRIKVLLNET